MRRYLSVALACLAIVSAARAQDEIVHEDNAVYICTFNVMTLGEVAQKYWELPEYGNIDVPLGGAIPGRVKNLAKVLAIGKFDLVSIQELRAGPRGLAALADLAKQLKDAHGLTYDYLQSDQIGRGKPVPPQLPAHARSNRVPLPAQCAET